ncbi:hypothetical protein [Streptomyces sp. JJ38]|uniref:hypothetical protein n=1 Tax=Streptomyces sp. JJ38 TaxID=2738128 RepID=UPI001C59C16D|nr:hypothetical protein [Streptomyces sp. JJ38]MBW1595959.1 hypothetical protein [Streptomyces sp. JJ38]
MDWHHWAHERDETRAWIDRITAPGGVAEGWTLQVGKRLLGLSRTAVDPPFWPILDKWTSGSASAGADRIHTVAHLLTEAAQDDQLARDAHKKLLDWAKNVNAQQREVVAHVCSGSYGRRWPHRALVRLRHILDRDDAATEVAASALVAYAARTTDGLTRVVDTIESWLDRYETSPAGPRAFLALIEPASDNRVLANLIDIARTTPRILDFLIGGWSATLQQPDVREQAHRVLLGWARAVHEGQVDRDFTFKILTDVRNAHTPVDAMSRFLYGSPEHEDPALVDARLTLANLRACNHFECSRSDCPLRKPPSAPTADSAAEGAGEPGQ